MNKYVATFGSGQVNEGYYISFEANSIKDVKGYMNNEYDGKYCMVYEKSNWDEWEIKAKEGGLYVERQLEHIILGGTING